MPTLFHFLPYCTVVYATVEIHPRLNLKKKDEIARKIGPRQLTFSHVTARTSRSSPGRAYDR